MLIYNLHGAAEFEMPVTDFIHPCCRLAICDKEYMKIRFCVLTVQWRTTVTATKL